MCANNLGDSGRDMTRQSIYLPSSGDGYGEEVSVTMTPEEYEKLKAEANAEGKTISEKWRENLENGRNDTGSPAHNRTENGETTADVALKEAVLDVVSDHPDGITEQKLREEIEAELTDTDYEWDATTDDAEETKPAVVRALEALDGTRIDRQPGVGYVPRGEGQ